MIDNPPAEGNFPEREPYYQPVSEPRKPIQEREWNEQAKPFKRKIVNTDYYTLLKYLVGILAIGVLLLGYSAWQDKFKTTIDIPDCNCPEISIPSCPSDNISCSPVLNCGQMVIPSNLSINLVNGS